MEDELELELVEVELEDGVVMVDAVELELVEVELEEVLELVDANVVGGCNSCVI